ncbi:MAG TPA: SpoIIE family protein phosphatase [Bryobacteraceae bacterium]|nr:SpoIIE family protein phosphatase [Bryobacteraceae bacterium]
MPSELAIHYPSQPPRTMALTAARLSVGRSSAADLCFPEDTGLSRVHFAFEPSGEGWSVQDLGSKNGTYVNDIALKGKLVLKPGDRVTAGHLLIVFSPGPAKTPSDHVVVFEGELSNSPSTSTVVTTLRASSEALGQSTIINRGGEKTSAVEALIQAGRVLLENRPLEDLFPVILDLAIRVVGAQRGALMSLEGDSLRVRAHKGDGFRISSHVRDKVLNEKASILVRDAQLDANFKDRMSIVEQKVHTMMAVPLQTEERIMGLLYVDSPFILREFTKDDLSLLTVMANTAAIRIENARLAEIEETDRRTQRDLSQAAEIQRSTLPATPPRVPGADIAGFNAPCRTVGGDYYDYFVYPGGRTGLALGDVSGKGMPASLMAMALHARVQVLAADPGDLAAFMTRLNKTTCANCPSNRFVTFFFSVFDANTGEVTYASAGHNPPVLVRASGESSLVQGGGPVLGLLPFAPYQEMRLRLDPGDLLAIYSDGVTEANNLAEEEFGEERLCEVLRDHRGEPAESIVQAVRAALAAFTGAAPQADDITLVIAKRT